MGGIWMEQKIYHNPTLRVLKILETLDRADSGMTLTEIAESIGAAKSTISPILLTLLDKGYINLDNKLQKYVIGLRSFQLGLGYSKNSNTVDYVRKEMEDIVNMCNEVCQLGVLIDFEVFYLAKVDSKQPINLISYVGQKLPAYATALGKALLSGYSDEHIMGYYGKELPKIQKNTITDVEVLIDEVDKIRNGGLAYEIEEVNVGTACVAVPLKKDGEVIASISISYPLFRASDDKLLLIERILWDKKHVIEHMIEQLDFNFT